MSQENPLWGAPRIRGELLKLGLDVSQAAVAKYIGMTAAVAGNAKDAIEHLLWVKEQGDRSRAEYKLAVSELKRLRP